MCRQRAYRAPRTGGLTARACRPGPEKAVLEVKSEFIFDFLLTAQITLMQTHLYEPPDKPGE